MADAGKNPFNKKSSAGSISQNSFNLPVTLAGKATIDVNAAGTVLTNGDTFNLFSAGGYLHSDCDGGL